MKKLLPVLCLLAASCGLPSSGVMFLPGAGNVHTAEIPLKTGWNADYSAGRSLKLDKGHFFLASRVEGHDFTLYRFDDTLGIVWEQKLRTDDRESSPEYFSDGTGIRCYSTVYANDTGRVRVRSFDAATGRLLSTAVVAETGKNSTQPVTTFSRDSSRILVYNFEKSDSAVLLHLRVFSQQFEPIREFSQPVDFSDEAFPLYRSDKRKPEKDGSLSLARFYDNIFSYCIVRVSDEGEPLLYSARKSFEEIEISISCLLSGRRMLSKFPMNAALFSSAGFSYLTGVRGDSGQILTNNVLVADDSVRVLSSRFSLDGYRTVYSSYFAFPFGNPVSRDRAVDFDLLGRPSYFLKGLGIIALQTSVYDGYFYQPGGKRHSARTGPLTFVALDAKGGLAWAKTVTKAGNILLTTHDTYILVDAMPHVSRYGDKLRILSRERSGNEAGFSCMELDPADGTLRDMPVPFSMSNAAGGGVIFLSDLSQWLDDRTAVIAVREGQLSDKLRLIRFSVR